MKIICRDNYDRTHISDKLIAENVNLLYGNVIIDLLNSKTSGYFLSEFFVLVEDDYKLYVFQP